MSPVTPVSLLWPDGESKALQRHWQSTSVADLGLESLISVLDLDGKHGQWIEAILMSLCDDAKSIRYRQEIFDDLVNIPGLAPQFRDLLPMVGDLAYYALMSEAEGLPFQKTLARLGELELFVKAVGMFSAFLNAAGDRLHSTGLRALRDLLTEQMQNPDFQRMERELPAVALSIRELASITIGINLDHNLRPIGATLLSVNTQPFRGSSLFQKLFGERDGFQGVSNSTRYPKTVTTPMAGFWQLSSAATVHPLFRDLDRVINDTVRPRHRAQRLPARQHGVPGGAGTGDRVLSRRGPPLQRSQSARVVHVPRRGSRHRGSHLRHPGLL
jgi:hypothetical protein